MIMQKDPPHNQGKLSFAEVDEISLVKRTVNFPCSLASTNYNI